MSRRRIRIANRRRGGLAWRVPLVLAAWALVAAPQVAGVLAWRVYQRYAEGLPGVPDLDAFEQAAPRTSVILAADGTVLAEIPFTQGAEAGHRFWVRYQDLPEPLVLALLAAEDARFFEHQGVDLRAVARAAWANYRAGRTVEGASTITQQLARNLLPEDIGSERSARRKVREMLLARRIERRWSKPRILEAYANLVFLGAGAYGVAAGARAYFDRPLGELGPAEHALLAGLIQAPGRMNPYENPEAARARRDEVLDRMLRHGFLDQAAHAAARAAPLALARPRDLYGTTAPWMTERARRETQALDPVAFARGGLVIETSVLPATARDAELAVVRAAARVARRQDTPAPQAGALLYDHVTGYVEVEVGGLGWDESRFDRATQACRQPGSAFKPLVYAAGIERDAITPGTPLRDAPVTDWDEDRGVFWKPSNQGRAFRGVALAQDALAASLNAPAVDVIDRTGTQAVVELARRLGLSTEIDPVRPLVLGSSCVIPLELARAFSAFAARGRRVEPVLVTRVAAYDRASYLDPFLAPARRLDRLVAGLDQRAVAPVLDERSAFLVSSMLAEVVRAGTARDARALARPAAGKTGTTNGNTDAWFAGYTGRVVGAVWLGHDDPAQALGRREDGAHAALPLWIALARLVEGDRAPVPVPGEPPEGVVIARIDRETGLLARPGAGGATDVYFRAGTAPVDTREDLREVPRELDRVTREF